MIRRLLALPLILLAAPALAESWTVDPAQSALRFSGVQVGKAFEGRFESWQAEIDFDPAAPQEARVTVEIDLASAKTGDRQRDSALPEESWFAIADHPMAVWRAEGFEPLGKGRYRADGTLTLKGVSKKVPLTFTLDIEGDTARAAGETLLDRGVFGVGSGEWATDEWVGLDVTVEVDLVATR